MLAWHLVGLGDFSTSCVWTIWTVLTSMLTSSSILSKGQGTSCIIISCVVRVLLGDIFVNSCDTLLYTVTHRSSQPMTIFSPPGKLHCVRGYSRTILEAWSFIVAHGRNDLPTSNPLFHVISIPENTA